MPHHGPDRQTSPLAPTPHLWYNTPTKNALRCDTIQGDGQTDATA